MLKGKIFIKTHLDGIIYFEHHRPEIYALLMKKTEEDLLREGYLLDSMPIIDEPPGKTVVKKYTPSGGFTYWFKDNVEMIPASELADLKVKYEALSQQTSAMESAIAELSMLITPPI